MRPTSENPSTPRPRSRSAMRRSAAALSVLLILPALSTGSATASSQKATEDPTVIADWNALAVNTFAADPTKKTPETFLYMGFVQAAVYDAVVGIDGRYKPYLFHQRAPRGSSAQAAAVAAAHEVLVTYSPYAQTGLDAAYTASLHP